MSNLERRDGRVVLRTTVNFEGLTLPDGEVTFGAWGEGYLDSRHPHTFLHEAMLSLNLWEAGDGSFSLSAAAGSRRTAPTTRWPGRCRSSRRITICPSSWNAGRSTRCTCRWAVEAGLFAGTEPTGPWDVGNVDGFGRSWSARLSRWFGEGAAPQTPWEVSASYARVREIHHGAEPLAVLYNTAVRHSRHLGHSAVYGLVEFSVGDSEFDGRNFALLGESQVERGPHQPYIRVEYASRPEYRREGAPGTDAFFRYDHDEAAIGATRWLITSIGYGHQLTGYPASVRPFVELQHHRVRPERGGVRPAGLFGRSGFWNASVGLRLFFGGEPMRMGRYGVLDPMTLMHRQDPEAAHPHERHH